MNWVDFFMERAEQQFLSPPPEPKIFAKCICCNRDIYVSEQQNGRCRMTEDGVLCERCKPI